MKRSKRSKRRLTRKLTGLRTVLSHGGLESGLWGGLTKLSKNTLQVLPRETSRLPLVLSLVVTALWIWAAAPEITWFDTGELAGAGYELGLSHPPGQPLHTMACKLFSFIPLGTIGFRSNLLSGVCAGLSLLYIGRIAKTLWPHRDAAAVLVCVLGLALSPALTAQAVRTEVYSLTLLLVLVAYWSLSPHFSTRPLLYRGGLAQTLKLAQQARARRPADSQAPKRTIGVYAMTRLPVKRPVIVAGLSLALAAAAHPLLAFTVGIALGVVALIPILKRRALTAIPWGLGAVILGSLVWLYLPLVSGRDASIHLGAPSSFEGFLEMITARAYSQNVGTSWGDVPRRLYDLGRLIILLTGPFLLVASGISIFLSFSKKIGARISVVPPLFLLGSALVPPLMMGVLLPFNPDLHGYLLPSLAALFLLATWCVVEIPHKAFGSSRLQGATQAVLAVALLAPMALTHSDRLAEESQRRAEAHELSFRVSSATRAGPSLVVATNDHFLFPLLYAKATEDWRPDVAVAGSWLVGSTAHWYRHFIKTRWPWLFVPLVDDRGETMKIRRRFVSINAGRVPVYLESPFPDYMHPVLEDCGVLYGVVPFSQPQVPEKSPQKQDLSGPSPNGLCAAVREFPLILEPRSGRMIHCYVALERARYLAGVGRYDDALRQLKPHLATPPPKRWKNSGAFLCTTSQPYVMSAKIHIQKKRYLQAEIHLDYALKREPKRVDSLLTMGRLKAIQQKPNQAALFFRRVLEVEEQNVHALFYLAMIRGKRGATSEARTLFKKAHDADPKAFKALMDLHRRKEVPRRPPRRP